MSASTSSASKEEVNLILKNDRRDIKDLWNDAMKDYKAIVGKDLKMTFKNADDMFKFAVAEEDVFSKWRHDGKRLDRIRHLFMENIEYIDMGTSKLIAAATPAFPPAAAIGTALTMVLNASKGQSADYDAVANFFADMNSFLQRVSILEGRLPKYRAYQTCLMDVFTSFLRMCAFATKFIAKGRFKTWIINMLTGQDADLSSSRKKMDKNLAILQSATEIAILANTEGLKDGQQELKSMQQELSANLTRQYELAQEQTRLMEDVQRSQTEIKQEVNTMQTGVREILAMLKQTQDPSKDPSSESKDNDLNKLRTDIGVNTENNARFQELRDFGIAGIGDWLFQTSAWKSWSSAQDIELLLLSGPRGIGKSYITAAVYNYLRKAADADPDCSSNITYFYCDDSVDSLQAFEYFIRAVIVQISDQNSVLRDLFSQKLTQASEADPYKHSMFPRDYLERLIAPSFGRDSRYQLYIIVDDVDKLDAHTTQNRFIQMINTISELGLRVKILATTRSSSADLFKQSVQPSMSASVKVTTLDLIRDYIIQDIKTLMAARIQKVDKTYGDLAHFNPKSQDRIAASVQEKANTLLYVDIAFRYLCGIGREGAVLRELDAGLPAEIDVLLQRILNSCRRRLPQDLVGSIQLLMTWLTCSFGLLDLDQVNELLQTSAQNDTIRVEDEIEYAFGRILQIGPAKKTGEASGDELEKSVKNAAFVGSKFDDGDLVVSLRDQPMKEFLLNMNADSWNQRNVAPNEMGTSVLSQTSSTSHRTIFLQCCKILESPRVEGDKVESSSGCAKLRDYAMNFCLRHWQYIEWDKHEPHENLEVCNALYTLLANPSGFAAAIEATGNEYIDVVSKSSAMPIDDGHKVFSQIWQQWARSVSGDMKNSAIEPYRSINDHHAAMEAYWKGPWENAFLPLFNAHLENWLTSDPGDDDSAYNAFKFVEKLVLRIPFDDLSRGIVSDGDWATLDYSHDYDPQGALKKARSIYSIRALYDKPITSTSHFATAKVLMEEFSFTAARYELEIAVQKCSDMDQMAWIYLYLSACYNSWASEEDDKLTQDQQVIKYADLALELPLERASTVRHTMLLWKIGLLQAIFEKSQDESTYIEIENMLRELKVCSADDMIAGRDLLGMQIELLSSKNDGQCVDFFLALSPFQRLSLTIRKNAGLNSYLLPAAIRSHRPADLNQSYREILDNLNLGDCGMIWYIPYAEYLYRAVKDLQLAFDLLKEASNHVFEGLYIRLGPSLWSASDICEEYICLASDVAYQLFRSSNNPDTKLVILQQAEAIPLQPLLQSVRTTTTSSLPYLVVLARMQRRAGSYQKYQATLQQAFDICWANLHDDFISNDSMSMFYLAKTLAIAPGLRREADIVCSAQLYIIQDYKNGAATDDTSVAADLGNSNSDCVSTETGAKGLAVSEINGPTGNETANPTHDWALTGEREGWPEYPKNCSRWNIGHKCPNSVRWETWTEPMYTCLCCADSYLCQGCHDERIKRDKSGEVEGKIDFCCDGGEYLKAPMAGWKGIKNGVMYIENEEPIEFNVFLDQLREKWKQAWNDFWKG